MALNKAIYSWVRNYYYKDCGETPPDVIPAENNDFYEEQYKRLFVAPVNLILKTLNQKADGITLNTVVSTFSVSKLKTWTRLIGDIAHMVFEKYDMSMYSNNISGALQKAIDVFESATYKRVACTLYGSDVVMYYTKSDNKLLGNYDTSKFIITDLEETGVSTPYYLQYLARRSVTELDETQISLLRRAIKELPNGDNFIKELTTQLVPIPNGNEFVLTQVNALTENLPPSEVLRAIQHIPTATLAEHENNPYKALNSLKDSKWLGFSDKSKQYLSTLFGFSAEQSVMPVSSTNDLTDDVVLAYINEKFGTSYSSLSAAVPQNVKSLLSNCSMITEDTFDAVVESDDYVTGTLDEIIANYCKEEGISLNCTIEQLLQILTDNVMREPKSLQEMVAEYKASNNTSGYTTLDQFILNEKIPAGYMKLGDNTVEQQYLSEIFDSFFILDGAVNVNVNSIFANKSTLTTLMAYSLLPESTQEDIKSCVIKNVKFNSYDIKSILNNLSDNDKSISFDELSTQEQNVPAEINSDKEYDILVKRIHSIQGIDTNTANILMVSLLDGEPLKLNSEVNDVGYRVANFILRNFRELLVTRDSIELRQQMLPMLYGFSRILMLKHGDEKEAAEFLNNKAEESSGEIADIMRNAASMLQ